MNLNINGRLPRETDADKDYSSMPSNSITLIGEIASIINLRIVNGEDKHSLMQKSSRLIMISLARKDGVTQLGLVRDTHLKAPTVSVTLQRLEKEGYIERKPDSYDLRAIRVCLTERGRDYTKYMINRVRREENTALQGLTDAEERQLNAILVKLRDSMISEETKNKY